MTNPIVTIIIPNYKTPDLTKLCLRLLRKYSDLKKIHVIVVDNDSQDASTEYLRSLKWIELIERKAAADDTPPLSHSRALDLALTKVSTPYFLVMHTDTMVKNSKWLDFLLKHIVNHPNVAGVGSWKLESKTWLQHLAKIIERNFQLLWYGLVNKKKHAIEGIGDNYYYLRSHCALYRTDLVREFNLTFSLDKNTAGKALHKKLANEGYDMIFLPSESLGKYMDHINHATMVLNPELSSREKSVIKGNKRILKALKGLDTEAILNDDSLDRP